jgi:hypothetical protein
MTKFNRNPLPSLIIAFLIASCVSNDKKLAIDSSETIEVIDERAIQKEIVDPEIVRNLDIKFLEIENCLENSQCYKEKIEFNEFGQIKNYYPAMVSTWWHYEYDNQGRLASAKGFGHMYKKYTYLDNDTVMSQYFDISNDTLETLAYEAKFKLIEEISDRGLYNSSGRLLIDTIGRLSFPCGNDYLGQHIVKYNYFDNGLLESKQYLDPTNTIVVDERYYYSKNNGIRIDFE